MVLQKLWVSQNFSRISRVSQSRFLAVMYVSQSRFLYEGVWGLGVSIFCKTKGISEKKPILTLPVVWIPQKARKLTATSFGARKKQLF